MHLLSKDGFENEYTVDTNMCNGESTERFYLLGGNIVSSVSSKRMNIQIKRFILIYMLKYKASKNYAEVLVGSAKKFRLYRIILSIVQKKNIIFLCNTLEKFAKSIIVIFEKHLFANPQLSF